MTPRRALLPPGARESRPEPADLPVEVVHFDAEQQPVSATHARWKHLLMAAFMAAAALLTSPAEAHAATAEPSCKAYSLPVRLSDTGEATQTMWGQLCQPSDRRPTTVQLLVHGGYHTHTYWDFP